MRFLYHVAGIQRQVESRASKKSASVPGELALILHCILWPCTASPGKRSFFFFNVRQTKTSCFGLVSLPALTSCESFVWLFAFSAVPQTFLHASVCNRSQPGLLRHCLNSSPLGQTVSFALSSEAPGSISKSITARGALLTFRQTCRFAAFLVLPHHVHCLLLQEALNLY